MLALLYVKMVNINPIKLEDIFWNNYRLRKFTHLHVSKEITASKLSSNMLRQQIKWHNIHLRDTQILERGVTNYHIDKRLFLESYMALHFGQQHCKWEKSVASRLRPLNSKLKMSAPTHRHVARAPTNLLTLHYNPLSFWVLTADEFDDFKT